MKKVFALFAALVLALALAGCAPKTEYDDKVILKIENYTEGGEQVWGKSDYRVFDFEKNTVYDVSVIEIFAMQNSSSRRDGEIYRHETSETVCTFTDEQEAAFVSHVRKAGIYAWKDSYRTDEIILDAGSVILELTFSDGTIKSTSFYFKYPRNFHKIRAYFLGDLGADLRYGK